MVERSPERLFERRRPSLGSSLRGRFEGDLVVHNRLLIKATGRVSGTIRYGQIEIECGGQIFGDIQAQSPGEARETPRS